MLDFISKTPIHKGWSCDQKYCAATADGAKYLLRVTPKEKAASRPGIFHIQQELAAMDVPMCQPVEMGECEEGTYIIQTWIDGMDAEALLPALTEMQQYAYGLDAGRILQRIHSIPAPANQESWEIRFSRKMDRKIQTYEACPLQFEGASHFIRYINSHRHLLKNRPQCFQHGDYHIGNMMVDQNGRLVIIDFDRYDYGDPWEEFNRIVWCAQASPFFASGMVNGYFDDNVPEEFWELLALYICSNTLSSLPWAIPFGRAEIDVMLNQAKDILSWYGNMENTIPSWYQGKYYLQYFDPIPFHNVKPKFAYKLKKPFDFRFLEKYGKVTKVFDDQDSGNICFRAEKNGEKYFIKFAGAPTAEYDGSPEDAILRLKETEAIYRSLRHESLISLIGSEAIGGGFAIIFRWAEGDCMGRMYPAEHRRFMALPLPTRWQIFRDILDFLSFIHQKGYVAIDFYDGSILYDSKTGKTTICDIDLFQRQPYVNEMGRMWGSSRFMSPEEFEKGARIDEVTNVYNAGAMAFALFGNYQRSRENWQLSSKAFDAASKAASSTRHERYPSIKEFAEDFFRNI